MFIEDKIRLLEEVKEALHEDGVARIDLWTEEQGKHVPYITIRHDKIQFDDYVRQDPSLEKKMIGKRPYLEVRKKGKGVDVELERVEENEEGLKHSFYKLKKGRAK